MKHPETRRHVPDAKNAVLFLHGICGTPNHFRELLPLEELVPSDWSVYNLCLPGHGGSVSDFGRSSMKKWQSYAQSAFVELAQKHEKVVLVGHSMGTLFSIQMALKNPEKTGGLFLIAVPFRVGIKLFGVCNLLRLAFGCLNKKDPVQAATETVCGIDTTWKVWQYIPWLPRMWELVKEMHATSDMVGELAVPCVAFQSERDELVSNRSRRILEKCGRAEVHNLLHSTHFYYHPEEIQTVQQRFAVFLESI